MNTASIPEDLLATLKAASVARRDVAAQLNVVAPLLTDTLRSHWSTGQGSRVRRILWSLYNAEGVLCLGGDCSGLDFELAEAVAIAIRARLILGADVEDQLRGILESSGEFERYETAAAAHPQEPIDYPPSAISPERLRNILRSIKTDKA